MIVVYKATVPSVKDRFPCLFNEDEVSYTALMLLFLSLFSSFAWLWLYAIFVLYFVNTLSDLRNTRGVGIDASCILVKVPTVNSSFLFKLW